MIEKGYTVKNPLTIIAIFAGLAEVSGTAVLPSVSAENQIYYIFFLIFFPTLLVVLFFITLYNKHKVLYGPSDFEDEKNFVKILQYDKSKQENVEINLKKEEVVNKINSLNEKYGKLENQYNLIQHLLVKISDSKTDIRKMTEDISLKDKYKIVVENITDHAPVIVDSLTEKGFFAVLSKNEIFKGKTSEAESIWVGRHVPVDIVVEVIKTAKITYPFLKYISIAGDHTKDPPEYVHYEIFIGGSTSAAKKSNIKELKDSDFENLYKLTENAELHRFIKSFYCKNQNDK